MNVKQVQFSLKFSSDNILRKRKNVIDMNKTNTSSWTTYLHRASFLFMLYCAEINEKCQVTDLGRRELRGHTGISRRLF